MCISSTRDSSRLTDSFVFELCFDEFPHVFVISWLDFGTIEDLICELKADTDVVGLAVDNLSLVDGRVEVGLLVSASLSIVSLFILGIGLGFESCNS